MLTKPANTDLSLCVFNAKNYFQDLESKEDSTAKTTVKNVVLADGTYVTQTVSAPKATSNEVSKYIVKGEGGGNLKEKKIS